MTRRTAALALGLGLLAAVALAPVLKGPGVAGLDASSEVLVSEPLHLAWPWSPEAARRASWALHILAVVLLYAAVAGALEKEGCPDGDLLAAAAAAVFAVHPLQAETLGSAASLPVIAAAAAFGACALLFCAGWPRVSAAVFALSVWLSPMAAAGAVWLPAAAGWDRKDSRQWRSAALWAASVALIFQLHQTLLADADYTPVRGLVQTLYVPIESWARFLFLTPLAPLSGFPQLFGSPAHAAEAAAALAAVAVAALLLRSSSRLAWLGYFACFVGIAPAARNPQWARACWTYLPLAAAAGAACLTWARLRPKAARLGASGQSLALAAVVLVLACATFRRASWWSDPVGLWTRALAVDPQCAECEAQIGQALARQGSSDSLTHLERSASLSPEDAQAQLAFARAALSAGRFEQAARVAAELKRLDPGAAAPLSVDFFNASLAAAGRGRPTEAVELMSASVLLDPSRAEAHFDLGIFLSQLGRMPEAIRATEQAVRLNPDSPGAHFNLGVFLAAAGRIDEAERHYREAFRLNPGASNSAGNLIGLLVSRGRVDEARAICAQATSANPQIGLRCP